MLRSAAAPHEAAGCPADTSHPTASCACPACGSRTSAGCEACRGETDRETCGYSGSADRETRSGYIRFSSKPHLNHGGDSRPRGVSDGLAAHRVAKG
jgi:hypothetical protein